MTATGSQEPRNRTRPVPAAPAATDLAGQIALVARGETTAFDAVFEQIGPSVFGDSALGTAFTFLLIISVLTDRKSVV